PDGRALRIYDDPQRTASEFATLSKHDAERYAAFHQSFTQLGAALRPFLSITPPDMDRLAIDDYLNFGKFGLRFRGLERHDAQRLLRWGPMPVADLAAEWFENELLRATVVARGIFGSFAGPRSPGTSAGLLIQAALSGDALLTGGGVGSLPQ